MQSLGKIVERAPAVGAKMWCLSLFLPAGCRESAITAGIKFTHRAKIRFFAPQGRLVSLIHVKLSRADGHVMGSLGCAKFHLNRHRGMGMRP